MDSLQGIVPDSARGDYCDIAAEAMIASNAAVGHHVSVAERARCTRTAYLMIM